MLSFSLQLKLSPPLNWYFILFHLGLFREFNPIFVFLFSLITKVLKVATTEEQGGEKLCYLISSPELKGVNGQYYSSSAVTKKLVDKEFKQSNVSIEAQDQSKCAQLWELTEKLLENAK